MSAEPKLKVMGAQFIRKLRACFWVLQKIQSTTLERRHSVVGGLWTKKDAWSWFLMTDWWLIRRLSIVLQSSLGRIDGLWNTWAHVSFFSVRSESVMPSEEHMGLSSFLGNLQSFIQLCQWICPQTVCFLSGLRVGWDISLEASLSNLCIEHGIQINFLGCKMTWLYSGVIYRCEWSHWPCLRWHTKSIL